MAFSFSLPKLEKSKELNKAEPKTKKDLIPLEVKEVKSKGEKNSLMTYAKLKDVTTEGKSSGIDQMLLEGKIIETENKKTAKTITIIWQKALLGKEKVEIENPLQSKISIKGNLKEGDTFSAKGDAEELIKAWNKIKISKSENQIIKPSSYKSKEDKRDISSAGRSDTDYLVGSRANSSTPLDNQKIPDATPDFSAQETVSTTDGCKIRIDLATNLAIVQKRVLKGGEEISPCKDSDISYPINKDYNQCSDYIDFNQQKVFKQYRLTYSNPNVEGNILVQDCITDYEQSVAIIEDYNGCSLSHNFKENYSIQQKRSVYYDNNNLGLLIRDCHDSDKIYLHQETSEGCKDEIVDDKVIWSTRKYVKIDGKRIYVSECLPKNNTIDIHEEECLEKLYTHDFISNQSFLNKNYYYYRDNLKTYIQQCSRSEVVFNHKEEIGACNIENNDTDKTSQLYSKTFIEHDGNKVYLTECQKNSAPIPYILNRTKWLVKETYSGNNLIITPNIFPSVRLGWGYWTLWENGNLLAGYGTDKAPYDYCYNNSIPDSWMIIEGSIDLDEENSDEFPSWEVSHRVENRGFGSADWVDCFNPYCIDFTALVKVPIYVRYDGTDFIDYNQYLETKYVCGTGSLLEGKEESI